MKRKEVVGCSRRSDVMSEQQVGHVVALSVSFSHRRRRQAFARRERTLTRYTLRIDSSLAHVVNTTTTHRFPELRWCHLRHSRHP